MCMLIQLFSVLRQVLDLNLFDKTVFLSALKSIIVTACKIFTTNGINMVLGICGLRAFTRFQ